MQADPSKNSSLLVCFAAEKGFFNGLLGVEFFEDRSGVLVDQLAILVHPKSGKATNLVLTSDGGVPFVDVDATNGNLFGTGSGL